MKEELEFTLASIKKLADILADVEQRVTNIENMLNDRI